MVGTARDLGKKGRWRKREALSLPSPHAFFVHFFSIGAPHTQIPSEMGIPGRDTQNTDSYTDKRLEEAKSFCH